MKFLDLKFIKDNEEFILSEMKSGKIFIYPTDTLFGIGCISNNSNSIQKIFDIKKRKNKSLLVIVPSINWIKKNCIVDNSKLDLIKSKLPAEYSFILKLKKINFEIISDKLLCNENTIGVRIPNCYFSKFIEKLKVPFVTTSVNLSGESPATRISEIDKEILEKVDYVLENDFKLLGVASSLFDLSGNKIIKLR